MATGMGDTKPLIDNIFYINFQSTYEVIRTIGRFLYNQIQASFLNMLFLVHYVKFEVFIKYNQFEMITFLFYFWIKNVLSKKLYFYLYFENSLSLRIFKRLPQGGGFGTKTKKKHFEFI